MNYLPKSTYRLRAVFAVFVFASGAVAGAFTYHSLAESRWEQRLTAAEEERDWQAALSACRELSRFREGDADFWLRAAECARQADDPLTAADALQRLPESDPRSVNALLLRADLLFNSLNQPFQAADTWQSILMRDPSNATATQRLIYFYALTLQRQKLVRMIRDAMQKHIEPPEAYTYLILAGRLRFSNALLLIRRWRQFDPNREELAVADAYFSSLREVYGDQKLPSSAEGEKGGNVPVAMQQCLELYPRNLEVLAFHAERALVRGDLKRLREVLLQAPTAAENDGRFWRFRGWLLHAGNNDAESARAYRTALQHDPYDWRARMELATVLRAQGDTESAAKQAETALLGKSLERSLLELPNASALDGPLIARIYRYAESVKDNRVLAALRYRGVEAPTKGQE